jgi:hypothetical protein
MKEEKFKNKNKKIKNTKYKIQNTNIPYMCDKKKTIITTHI